ncbi:MAG TPA: hypothetical protein VK691_01460 [Solirubrobacteraceae bacterium]|jgi:hypothetical protein|nr:hypothetical protein [Solirubrobacteraceae bacterium]
MRGDIEVGARLPDYELPDQREQFLVSPVEGEAIRYTEGTEVGVKR